MTACVYNVCARENESNEGVIYYMLFNILACAVVTRSKAREQNVFFSSSFHATEQED